MITQDPIRKWKKVDVKVIHRMHATFDIESGQFLDKSGDYSVDAGSTVLN